MTCEYCEDGDGACVFPMYGFGPHKHVRLTDGPGSFIGSTVMEPKEAWPANYEEDADCPGLGTFTHCLNCGAPGALAGDTGGEARCP